MVLVKIALVGLFVAVMLGVAKQQRWFERSGLVSSCMEVSAPAGQDRSGSWQLCREGIMTGYPVLERDNCESMGFVVKEELWHCDMLGN